MNENIATVLAAVADEIVPLAPPQDLWRRGRLRRRLRRGATVLSVVGLVAVAVLLPQVRTGGRDSLPPAAPQDALPARVEIPWLWQATVAQWAPGPAAVAFSTSHTIYLESTGVVVGRGGAYRLLPMGVGDELGPLSPDGRYAILLNGPRLVDLTTGASRTLAGAGRPIAWSRDSATLLTMVYQGDAVIRYGPDGGQLNNLAEPSAISVVDVASGSVRTLGVAEDVTFYSVGSFAPDGSRVVVTVGQDDQTLRMLDVSTGSVRWSVPLGLTRSLAGTQAWSPDGKRIALFTFTGCVGLGCYGDLWRDRQWRLEFLDAATGERIPGADIPVTGVPSHLLGWRHGTDPVFNEYDDLPGQGGRTRLVAVDPHGHRDVLLVPAAGIDNIDVPLNLVEQGDFGGPLRAPNPWAMRWEAVVSLLLFLGAVLVGVRLMRRRRKATVAPTP